MKWRFEMKVQCCRFRQQWELRVRTHNKIHAVWGIEMYALTDRSPVTSLGLRWVLITELYLSLSGHLNGGQGPATLCSTNRQPIIVSSGLPHTHWADVWLAADVSICMQNLDNGSSTQECSLSLAETHTGALLKWMVNLIWQNQVRVFSASKIIANFLVINE